MSEISQIPRNALIGFLADALARARSAAPEGPIYAPAPLYPKKILEALMGKAPEVLDDLSYGFTPTRGTGLATQVSPDVLDVTGMTPTGSIKTLAKTAAKGIAESMAAKTGVGGGLMAALAPGLREDLIATHMTRASRLIDPEKGGIRAELYSPSMAISPPGTVSKHFYGEGDSNVVFVPRSGAFDPKYDVTTLGNRDLYTARYPDYPGSASRIPVAEGDTSTAEHARRKHAQNRLTDRFQEPAQVKGGEGLLPNSAAHVAAIMESPHFRSFKEFESSPKGAALLTREAMDIEDYDDAFTRKGYNAGFGQVNYKDLKSLAPASADARDLLQMARRAPSEYAELKAHGPIQVSPERWAGAIVTPPTSQHHEEAYQQTIAGLLARGLTPVSPLKHNPSRTSLFDLADQLQRQAPAYGRADPAHWSGKVAPPVETLAPKGPGRRAS